MKTLPITFTRNGFHFRQVERTKTAAIYSKTHKDGGAETFEVIRIRHQREREAFGKTFEAGEAYPRNEQWGEFGWTYPDLASAEVRYRTLNAAKPALGDRITQKRKKQISQFVDKVHDGKPYTVEELEKSRRTVDGNGSILGQDCPQKRF